MDSLYFLIKSLSSGESPNLSNMNSDFPPIAKERPYPIFVTSEQRLDVSG